MTTSHSLAASLIFLNKGSSGTQWISEDDPAVGAVSDYRAI